MMHLFNIALLPMPQKCRFSYLAWWLVCGGCHLRFEIKWARSMVYGNGFARAWGHATIYWFSRHPVSTEWYTMLRRWNWVHSAPSVEMLVHALALLRWRWRSARSMSHHFEWSSYHTAPSNEIFHCAISDILIITSDWIAVAAMSKSIYT